MRLADLVPHAVAASFVALCLSAPAVAAAAAHDVKPVFADPAVDGRYIVVYDRGVDVDAETDRQQRARGFRARFRYRAALKGFAAKLSPGQVRALRADADVAYVTPDRRVRALGAVPLAAGEPAPPPGVRRIQAATLTTTREAGDVGVAVIDTGIDLAHSDLDAAAGANCVTPGAAPSDDNGHGTHVAGTIGARNDGAGVVGVAPGTRVYAVKVLDAGGSGSWSQVICGLDWVTANASRLGIEVANLSLGALGSNDYSCGATNGDALHAAICRSTDAGILHVVAAGNDGWDIGGSPPDVPASYPEVLTVTAMADSDGAGGGAGAAPACDPLAPDDRYASFSNYARTARDAAHVIAAPGVCIRSTWPGGRYATLSGTSMAAPHVAGAAALCLAEGGLAGPCAGKTPAETIVHLRGAAATKAIDDPAYGFAGDPLQPNESGDEFGHLVHTPQDVTPPETTIASGPSGATASTTVTFAFASEPGATFACRLDGGAWAACSSPASHSGLADGDHTFEVRATDVAGNVDASPAARTFVIDTAPPDTSITGGPPSPTNDPTPTFALAADESGATFECRVDAGAWSSCPASPTTTKLADGAHTFEARAKDAAGNLDPTPAAHAFMVDTTAPDTSITSGPPALTNDATPTFAFASEAGATFECRVDGAAWAACSSPHTTAALADGDHAFDVRAMDGAGNADAAPATRSFSVDTVAADTAITSGPGERTKSTTPTFEFASGDAGARFACRVDSGAWQACSSPHRTATLSTGAHTFAVRATDAATNEDPTPAISSFTIDTTSGSPPRASSAGATDLAPSSATITGTVNPNGEATSYRFEYGTTSAYASSTPERTLAGGTTDAEVSGSLSGLRAATTYHYRVVATNASGTARGADRTFTTLAPPPAPSSAPAPAPAARATAPAAPSAEAPASAETPASGEAPASAPPRAVATAHPAKLQIRRAQVRGGRLSVLAAISRRASGRVRVTFHAKGRKTRFTVPVDADRGRIRFARRLRGGQARATTGIVTLAYRGNARTRPQTVRLRAARTPARLTAQRPAIDGGRLRAAGTVTGRARGVVRIGLSYVDGDRDEVFHARAKIRKGRWSIAGVEVPAAARRGAHATILFTGYGARAIRGEMRSLAVAGG